MAEGTELAEAWRDKVMIEVETEKLFEEILKDVLKDSRQSEEVDHQESQEERLDLSGEVEKERLKELNRKKLYLENKAKYEAILLGSLRSKFKEMEEELRQLREYKATQGSEVRKEGEILARNIGQLMEEESNKEQILVEIAKLLDLDQQRQREFVEWKEEVASHRKLFSKYTTIMTEYYPFASEDVLHFFQEVNQQFEFNLGDEIGRLRGLESEVKENLESAEFKSLLARKEMSNTEKINYLYEQNYLSYDPSQLNKDILHLLTIQKTDEIGRVYEKLVNEKEERMREEWGLKVERVEQEVKKAIKVGVDRFKEMEKLYEGILHSERKGEERREISGVPELEEYFKGEIERVKELSNRLLKKYNPRKTYFRLVQNQVK